jgi:hypothetical protein
MNICYTINIVNVDNNAMVKILRNVSYDLYVSSDTAKSVFNIAVASSLGYGLTAENIFQESVTLVSSSDAFSAAVNPGGAATTANNAQTGRDEKHQSRFLRGYTLLPSTRQWSVSNSRLLIGRRRSNTIEGDGIKTNIDHSSWFLLSLRRFSVKQLADTLLHRKKQRSDPVTQSDASSILVVYTIVFTPSAAEITNNTEAVKFIADQLSTAIYDGSFHSLLRYYSNMLGADEILGSVTSVSLFVSPIYTLYMATPTSSPSVQSQPDDEKRPLEYSEWPLGYRVILPLFAILLFLAAVGMLMQSKFCSSLVRSYLGPLPPVLVPTARVRKGSSRSASSSPAIYSSARGGSRNRQRGDNRNDEYRQECDEEDIVFTLPNPMNKSSSPGAKQHSSTLNSSFYDV